MESQKKIKKGDVLVLLDGKHAVAHEDGDFVKYVTIKTNRGFIHKDHIEDVIEPGERE